MKDLTTFVCLFGKFRSQRMPFGLKNAPAVFQQLKERCNLVVLVLQLYILIFECFQIIEKII